MLLRDTRLGAVDRQQIASCSVGDGRACEILPPRIDTPQAFGLTKFRSEEEPGVSPALHVRGSSAGFRPRPQPGVWNSAAAHHHTIELFAHVDNSRPAAFEGMVADHLVCVLAHLEPTPPSRALPEARSVEFRLPFAGAARTSYNQDDEQDFQELLLPGLLRTSFRSRLHCVRSSSARLSYPGRNAGRDRIECQGSHRFVPGRVTVPVSVPA